MKVSSTKQPISKDWVALALDTKSCEAREAKEEDKSSVELNIKDQGMALGVRAKGAKLSGKMSLPPSIELTHVVTGTRAFQSSSVTARACNPTNLMVIFGAVATTSTTIQPIASSFKIHSITIWPSPSSTGTAFADLWWNVSISQFSKDTERISVIPEGVSVTTPVKFVPPKNSLAAEWQTSSSNSLFTIVSSPGSVVYVHASYTISNTSIATVSTVATATSGLIYYGYLDGPGTHAYQPVGVLSTF